MSFNFPFVRKCFAVTNEGQLREGSIEVVGVFPIGEDFECRWKIKIDEIVRTGRALGIDPLQAISLVFVRLDTEIERLLGDGIKVSLGEDGGSPFFFKSMEQNDEGRPRRNN